MSNKYEIKNVYGNSIIILLFIVFVYMIIGLITSKYIITDQLYYHTLSEQLSYSEIHSILNIRHKYIWIGYVLIPVLIFIKEGYAALSITIGLILFGVYVNYKTVFKAALIGELVFVFEGIYRVVGLLWFVDIKTTKDITLYSPLSILGLFNKHKVVSWLVYPLHTLNLFELLYCLVVAWMLSKSLDENYTEILSDTIISYGAGLILLMVTVMFLSLQISA